MKSWKLPVLPLCVHFTHLLHLNRTRVHTQKVELWVKSYLVRKVIWWNYWIQRVAFLDFSAFLQYNVHSFSWLYFRAQFPSNWAQKAWLERCHRQQELIIRGSYLILNWYPISKQFLLRNYTEWGQMGTFNTMKWRKHALQKGR